MLFYRAAVDLSRSTLNYVAGIVRRHRKAIGSTWRLLTPGRQALLVLVHLRKGETFEQAGAGFEVSTSTAWRYVEEVVALLSARSLKLTQALAKAKKDGLSHLVLDGTLIYTDRVRADRPYYSGKHRAHGMNIQVIASPDGTILWTSGALPGSVHDLTAAHAKLRGRRTRERPDQDWRLLHKLRCSPSKAGHLVKAIAVLKNYELTRG